MNNNIFRPGLALHGNLIAAEAAIDDALQFLRVYDNWNSVATWVYEFIQPDGSLIQIQKNFGEQYRVDIIGVGTLVSEELIPEALYYETHSSGIFGIGFVHPIQIHFMQPDLVFPEQIVDTFPGLRHPEELLGRPMITTRHLSEKLDSDSVAAFAAHNIPFSGPPNNKAISDTNSSVWMDGAKMDTFIPAGHVLLNVAALNSSRGFCLAYADSIINTDISIPALHSLVTITPDQDQDRVEEFTPPVGFADPLDKNDEVVVYNMRYQDSPPTTTFTDLVWQRLRDGAILRRFLLPGFGDGTREYFPVSTSSRMYPYFCSRDFTTAAGFSLGTNPGWEFGETPTNLIIYIVKNNGEIVPDLIIALSSILDRVYVQNDPLLLESDHFLAYGFTTSRLYIAYSKGIVKVGGESSSSPHRDVFYKEWEWDINEGLGDLIGTQDINSISHRALSFLAGRFQHNTAWFDPDIGE